MEFTKDSHCKACKAIREKKYYIKHREDKLVYRKKHYDEHREEQTADRKKYYIEHCEEILACKKKHYASHRKEKLEYGKKYHIAHCNEKHAYDKNYRGLKDVQTRRRVRNLHKFGITLEDYDALLATQNGVCAICGLPPNGKNLPVDHDHKTGKVRGLLCDRCNPMLGYAQDNMAILTRAIDYLIKAEKHE